MQKQGVLKKGFYSTLAETGFSVCAVKGFPQKTLVRVVNKDKVGKGGARGSLS